MTDMTADNFTDLRATGSAGKSMACVAVASYDLKPARAKSGRLSVSDTMLAGLLVIYPLLAIFAAAIVGLFLAGRFA